MPDHNLPEGHALVKKEELAQLVAEIQRLKVQQRNIYTDIKNLIEALGIKNMNAQPDMFSMMGKITELMNKPEALNLSRFIAFIQEYEKENAIVKP